MDILDVIMGGLGVVFGVEYLRERERFGGPLWAGIAIIIVGAVVLFLALFDDALPFDTSAVAGGAISIAAGIELVRRNQKGEHGGRSWFWVGIAVIVLGIGATLVALLDGVIRG